MSSASHVSPSSSPRRRPDKTARSHKGEEPVALRDLKELGGLLGRPDGALGPRWAGRVDKGGDVAVEQALAHGVPQAGANRDMDGMDGCWAKTSRGLARAYLLSHFGLGTRTAAQGPPPSRARRTAQLTQVGDNNWFRRGSYRSSSSSALGCQARHGAEGAAAIS